jgi:hypothetical protein
MNEIAHRELMQLATASRVVAADSSESAAADQPALGALLELQWESLLDYFRPKVR